MASFNLKANTSTVLPFPASSGYTGASSGAGAGGIIYARILDKANDSLDLKIDTAFGSSGRGTLKSSTVTVAPLSRTLSYTGGSSGRPAGGITYGRILDTGAKIITPSFLGLDPAVGNISPTFTLLGRLRLDAADRLVSFQGVSTLTKFWEPRLVSIDDVTREISVQPGEFRAAEVSLTLNNTDDFYSTIRTNEAIIGRKVEVLLGDAAIGEDDFTVIASGTVNQWSGDTNAFTVTGEDLSLNRLDQVIPGRIDVTAFPNLPDETPRELIPLVIGLVSSAGVGESNSGAIPAYLVDPAIGQTKYRYVACQKEVKDVPGVYVYGTLHGTSGVIHAITSNPTAGGSVYSVGDVLTIAGGTGGTVTVESVAEVGGEVLTVALASRGSGYTTGSGKATTGGGGSGCTVNILTINGYAVSTVDDRTVIDFDEDVRDPDRTNELELSTDIDGITDDGTAGGNRITNPAFIWREVLYQNGFTAADLDTDLFLTASTALASRTITGGFVAIDREETLRDIAEKFAESFNMTTVATRTGLICVLVPTPGDPPLSTQVEVDESQIARGSFVMGGAEDVASGLDYFYAKNWNLDQFDLSQSITDQTQVGRLNSDVRLTLNLDYVRDPTSAAAVANDKLFFFSDRRVVIRASVDAALLRSIDVGDNITFKHYAGIPFGAQSFRVLGAGLGFDGPSMLLNLTLVDLTQDTTPVTKDFLNRADAPEVIWSDTFREQILGVGAGLGLE